MDWFICEHTYPHLSRWLRRSEELHLQTAYHKVVREPCAPCHPLLRDYTVEDSARHIDDCNQCPDKSAGEWYTYGRGHYKLRSTAFLDAIACSDATGVVQRLCEGGHFQQQWHDSTVLQHVASVSTWLTLARYGGVHLCDHLVPVFCLRCGSFDTVVRLLNLGVSINTQATVAVQGILLKAERGDTLLHVIARYHSVRARSLLRMLLSHLPRYAMRQPNAYMNTTLVNADGFTAVALAARLGNKFFMQEWLDWVLFQI